MKITPTCLKIRFGEVNRKIVNNMTPYRLMLSFTDSVMRERQETSHDRTMAPQDTDIYVIGYSNFLRVSDKESFATEKTYNFTRKEKLYSGQ